MNKWLQDSYSARGLDSIFEPWHAGTKHDTHTTMLCDRQTWMRRFHTAVKNRISADTRVPRIRSAQSKLPEKSGHDVDEKLERGSL